VTARLIGRPLGIFEGSGDTAVPLLGENGEPIAPIVNAIIWDKGEIQSLSLKDAQTLSNQLNAGRLPVQFKLIDERLLD
jgi:preprotein translocase subunit SecD